MRKCHCLASVEKFPLTEQKDPKGAAPCNIHLQLGNKHRPGPNNNCEDKETRATPTGTEAAHGKVT